MRAAIVCLLLVIATVGCAQEDPSDSPDEPSIAYSPITRRADLELHDPIMGQPPPAPPCQILVVNRTTTISNLTVAVEWMPKDDSLNSLRVWIEFPNGSVAAAAQGPSPFVVTAPTFNATAGQKVGMFVGRTSPPSPTALPLSPQSIRFQTGFVWTVDPREDPEDRGRWETGEECA